MPNCDQSANKCDQRFQPYSFVQQMNRKIMKKKKNNQKVSSIVVQQQ